MADQNNPAAGAGSDGGAAPDAAAVAATAAAEAAKAAGAGGGDGGGAGDTAGDTPKGLFDLDRLDPDVRKVVTRKHWETITDASDLVRHYENLEKHVGADPLQRPKADAQLGDYFREHGQVFGVPEKPDGYKIELGELPDGVQRDEAREKAFLEYAHSKGMPQALVQAMVDFARDEAAASFTKSKGGYDAEIAAEDQALRAEWPGEVYQAKMTEANRGAAFLGFDEKTVSALQAVVGHKQVLMGLAKLGGSLTEDQIVTSGAAPRGGVMGVTEAKAELDRVYSDEKQMAVLKAGAGHPEFAATQARIQKLQKLAHTPAGGGQ